MAGRREAGAAFCGRKPGKKEGGRTGAWEPRDGRGGFTRTSGAHTDSGRSHGHGDGYTDRGARDTYRGARRTDTRRAPRTGSAS